MRRLTRLTANRTIATAAADPRRPNKALSQLIQTGRLREARKLFDSLPDRNVVTWNSMITGYVRHCELSLARKLFDEMPDRNLVSWNAMLSGYALSRDAEELEEGRELFERMPKKDVISWNTMINACARNGKMDEAVELFDRMPERNVVSWNTLITGFLGIGDLSRALDLFETMPVRDAASLNAVVSGLVRNGKLEEAEEILLQRGSNVKGAVDAYNTLIAKYGQMGMVEEACTLFYLIPKDDRSKQSFQKNVVSWNSMIMCYLKAGDLHAARGLFDKMPERDLVSWNTMIAGYVQALKMEEAVGLFEKLHKPDTWSWNSIICGFMQKGDVERAREFFDRMPQKGIVSWNTMISGYEQNGDCEGSIKLFSRMLAAGERPDHRTLTSVLSACGGSATLRQGIQIHQMVIKTILPDIPINNALVTMYSRCGAMMDANAVFDGMAMHQRDVVSWNAMIAGFSYHGHAKKALDLFEKMKRAKVRPTHITFISVLHACGHAGLVAEGKKAFDSMVHEFGIMPRVEHYASLVDLIGRSGQLDEAMDVINGMLVPPDKSVWGALLAACRVYNNVELAQVAAKALAEVDPNDSSNYVLLSNIHADEGRWSDAIQVREMMHRSGIVKQPGYSWIELQNKVHVFLSGERYHPSSSEIYSLLDSCYRIIRDISLD